METKCIEYQGNCTDGHMGYLAITIGGKRFKAHRLVAMLFHGLEIQDTRSIVLHTCDNPRCINPEHLRVGTQKDNIHDCISKNRFKKPPRLAGEHNPKAKLTWEKVRQLRLEASLSSKSYKELAEDYKISATMVSGIVRGFFWKE